MNNRHKLFGLYFDDYSLDETLLYTQKNKSGRFRYIVTPNVDHVVRVNDKPDTKKLYEGADLSVCDSRILKILANNLNILIKDVVPGSDLVDRLFKQYIKKSDELTIIGGSEAVIGKLLNTYPVSQCHHYNPPMGFIEDDREVQKAVDFVLQFQTPYVFLAVGSPQQEKVAYLLKQSGKAYGIGLCIGASLLFLTGDEKRAPKWMQIMSLEWLYRLLKNPKRLLKRYLIDDMKIFKLYLQERQNRKII